MRRFATTRRQLLGIIGVAQLFLGASYLFPSPMPVGSRDRAFEWIVWLEPHHLGALTVISGAFACIAVAAGVAHLRGADRLERLAYGAVMAPYSALALVFLLSWVIGGNPTGWISTISYSAYTALAYAAAGVADPPDPPARTDPTMLPGGGDADA
ncbi:hypothetical protein [Gulosibacter massiliensis]|uniref:hypothetical protein n=1 Tax=Gulosibacter massiliensis TaxID=2479839 RepID=UPI000F637170|nr:hypothetical protein [Gulosibacter massiliensis]